MARRKGITEKRRRRMEEALRLRTAGMGYEQIAERTGVSTGQAHHDVSAALREITREPAEELLALQNQRLELMWRSIAPEIIRQRDKDDHKGLQAKDRAVNTGVKIVSQVARLNSLGYDTGKAMEDMAGTLRAQFDLMEQALDEADAEE